MTTATPATGKRPGRRATRARWARAWSFLGGVIEGAARLERRGDLTADESRAIREFVGGIALDVIRRTSAGEKGPAGQ